MLSLYYGKYARNQQKNSGEFNTLPQGCGNDAGGAGGEDKLFG